MSEKLGLIELGEKESAVAETLRVAKILHDNGVDLGKIKLSKMVNGKQKRTLLSEIKQKGIDIEKIIEENHLDREFPYGLRITQLRNAYKGTGNYPITEAEKRMSEKLGLIELGEKESAIAETLRVAKILHDNGVDLSKIKSTKRVNGKTKGILLSKIKQKGIDIEKIIEENHLDKGFKYGERINQLRKAYRGIGNSPITEAEKRMSEKLGLIELGEKESAIAETLRVAKILHDNGVDLSKIKSTKRVNGKQKGILLSEIKQKGIDIEKIIEENHLDREFPYGLRITELRNAYKGTGNYPITEAEKRMSEKLGLIELGEKESAVAETLRVAKILHDNGVDLSKIKLTKRVNGKSIRILLSEIKQKRIDIEMIIEENHLDREFPYGSRINRLRNSYNGIGTSPITEAEKRMAEELGLLNSEAIKRKLRSSVNQHVSTNPEIRAELEQQVAELIGEKTKKEKQKND